MRGVNGVRRHRATTHECEPKLKKTGDLLPDHEGLRRAVQWLAEQPVRDARTIDEACRRFDLSPLDEDFLLRHFLVHRDVEPES